MWLRISEHYIYIPTITLLFNAYLEELGEMGLCTQANYEVTVEPL